MAPILKYERYVMPSLKMSGSFDFSTEEIDKKVTEISPGNYALGKINSNKTFIVQYVGRSDSDVNKELKSCLSRFGISKYKVFKFSFASNAKEAFEKECKNYHDFGCSDKLQNSIHPARPEGKNYVCPECSIFD